jgi:hypothetical protein
MGERPMLTATLTQLVNVFALWSAVLSATLGARSAPALLGTPKRR